MDCQRLFGKACQHLLTVKHMSSTTDFLGETCVLLSRFAGGPCFRAKLFSSYLLKRTLSKSVLVLVGSEDFNESATKHNHVTQTLKKHTHRCFWKGNQQRSDSCPQAYGNIYSRCCWAIGWQQKLCVMDAKITFSLRWIFRRTFQRR